MDWKLIIGIVMGWVLTLEFLRFSAEKNFKEGFFEAPSMVYGLFAGIGLFFVFIVIVKLWQFFFK